MECKGRVSGKGYFKVVLIRVKADEYVILKGPEEEKRLAGALLNDYNSTRYEKMLQLLAEEVVQKEYREKFYSIFSMENILRKFGEGKTVVAYSYMRNIGKRPKMVDTRVYPRTELGGEIEEFIVYVACQ